MRKKIVDKSGHAPVIANGELKEKQTNGKQWWQRGEILILIISAD